MFQSPVQFQFQPTDSNVDYVRFLQKGHNSGNIWCRQFRANRYFIDSQGIVYKISALCVGRRLRYRVHMKPLFGLKMIYQTVT